ncbi:hypothetical protein BDR04DRAFT_31796 [Suillus decipiens]|nr:hypothetical protein BDR04DRAFT_31796 [Suillus decipiens]
MSMRVISDIDGDFADVLEAPYEDDNGSNSDVPADPRALQEMVRVKWILSRELLMLPGHVSLVLALFIQSSYSTGKLAGFYSRTLSRILYREISPFAERGEPLPTSPSDLKRTPISQIARLYSPLEMDKISDADDVSDNEGWSRTVSTGTQTMPSLSAMIQSPGVTVGANASLPCL